jgi:integrase
VDHLVPLTDTLIELFKTERKSGYVFSSDRDGKRSFSGFSKAKAALDRRLAEIRKQHGRPTMKSWSYHDLRRSCRSLLSRAGVSADIGERLLGHVIPGVRGVYDRYEYRKEKLAALEKLGALLERILHPSKKVVHFPKAR